MRSSIVGHPSASEPIRGPCAACGAGSWWPVPDPVQVVEERLDGGLRVSPRWGAMSKTDDVPEGPVSRLGDVWRLGPHRLVCGDATTAEAYARLFPGGERAHLLFTSPPYADKRGTTPSAASPGWDALMQGVFGAARSVLHEDAQILVTLASPIAAASGSRTGTAGSDGCALRAGAASPGTSGIRWRPCPATGAGASRRAMSSSSTSTDARASRTKSCPASRPG